MRKSVNSQIPRHQQQSQDDTEEESSDYESFEVKRKKKPTIIPRFVKNQIDEIDTNIIVINLSRTQYDVVQQVAKELGWQVERSKKSQKWDIMWIDSHIQAHDLFKLNEHQKISHFPAIYVLTRKNFLGRSLMKMKSYFPHDYNFFPLTWSIPADFTELLRFDENLDKSETSQYYIYKPQALAQGKGIKIYEDIEMLDGKTGIVQQYVNNPFLIENLKFDLRIYVLILGYDPLRIFIYDEGLGRFATEKYEKVQKKNMKDVHMHLTNYAINKNNKNFIFNNSEKDMNKGHKRSLTSIYNYLAMKGIDVNKIKGKIDQMIIKTLIVGQPMIAHTYGLAQADANSNDLCFQILGFDVLINQNLDPILLQVNHTPSFKTDTPLDKFIKKNLIKDTLNLLNVNTDIKKQKLQQKKQFIEMRSQRKLTKLSCQEKEQLRKKKWKQRDQYEMSHLGNFRKIFPTPTSYKYKDMIDIATKIFNQTNGIKNKGASTKLEFPTRPKSFEKRNIYMQTSPLLQNGKEKAFNEPRHIYFKQKQRQNLDFVEKDQKIVLHNNNRFPQISNIKKTERNRNYSGYMVANLKNQILKNPNKLERTTSYKNRIPEESQLFSKGGSYLLPKVMQMGQICSSPHKIVQIQQQIQSPPKGFHPHNIAIASTGLNKGVSLANNSRKNFEEIVSEATLQLGVSTLSPSKMTYENLLSSLSSSSAFNYQKQQFIKLKPIRKI